MEYQFRCYGHPNISSKHRTTLEFTKEENVTLKGDCIVGIKADFELRELKKFLNAKKILITIAAEGAYDEFTAKPNPGFSSEKEMVIRKTDFVSERTFANWSDKAGCDLNQKIHKAISKENSKIEVTIKS